MNKVLVVSLEYEVAVESSSPCIWNSDYYIVPLDCEQTLIEDDIPYEIMSLV